MVLSQIVLKLLLFFESNKVNKKKNAVTPNACIISGLLWIIRCKSQFNNADMNPNINHKYMLDNALVVSKVPEKSTMLFYLFAFFIQPTTNSHQL